MTQNHWASISGQQLASAYALEADAFGAIAMSPSFDGLISQFDNYGSYLKRLNKDSKHRETVRSLLENDGIIDTAVPTRDLAQLFCVAQIAACSELFKGWKINFSQLNREGIRALVAQGSAGISNIPEIPLETRPDQYSEAQRQLLNGTNIIQNVDTVRVLQVVKLLGLISTPASEVQQLSLGVGNGYRDLYGIHGVPCISKKQEGTSAILDFDTLDQQAAHTVLVDSDPTYGNHFEALNRDECGRVLALNIEAEQAIKILKSKQQGLDLSLRNFVVGLRIDHNMIPDAEKFLELIGTVIDSNADLMLTIGAGNKLSEFEGRLNCFDKLFAALTRIGLKPVRLLLHGRGSTQEQRGRPNFGQLAYTSYQILYCKLHRDRLL
jgi:hypothetical protein